MVLDKRKFMNSIVMITIITMLLIIMDGNIEIMYRKTYIVLSGCTIACLIFYLKYYSEGTIDLFSPITLFTMIYVFMFYVTPIYDLLIREYTWFNVNLFDQSIRCSFYALIGYVCFFIAYKYRFIINRGEMLCNKDYTKSEIICFEKGNSDKIVLFAVVGYFVCLLANIYYLVSSGGNSILYILTLGMMGNSGNDTVSNVGAISMLSYSLPSFTLLYVEYGKNRFLKILAFILMFELQVARGFRFFILQIVFMFGSYYFIKENKKPKFSQIIIVLIATCIPLILMTVFRVSIRSGEGMDLAALSSDVLSDALDAAFWENLRIYKNFYAIVKVVPSQTSYLYGAQTIIYTAIMMIPRAIWPSKPGNPGTIAQEIALGKSAVLGGSAYPALGEYYYDIGLLGIVIWMSIFGLFLSKIEDRYRYKAITKEDLMVFCTILGNVLQFIIRGYMPSNFWMLIFCILPYWIVGKCWIGGKL